MIQATQDKLNKLRLSGMAKALERQRETPSMQGLPFDDRFGMLVDAEDQERETRRLNRLRKSAHLKYENASFEGLDFRQDRNLNRQEVQQLFYGDWVQRGQHVLVTGITGTGKSWFACALGTQAMRLGFTVQYWRLPNLLDELDVARADGRLLRVRNRLRNLGVIILDDWGLSPLRPQHRQELLTLIDERCGNAAMIITAQLPVGQWYDYIGEPTVADAIMDRLSNSGHRVELKGESMRKMASNRVSASENP